jgi:hypothetical protein
MKRRGEQEMLEFFVAIAVLILVDIAIELWFKKLKRKWGENR